MTTGRLAGAVGERFRLNPIGDTPPLSPAAAYLLRSIAERLGDPGLARTAAAAIVFAAQVESLRAGLPGLLPLLRREGPEPAWEPHGDWLIGLAKTPESGKELLAAIVSNSVGWSASESAATLRRASSAATRSSIPACPSRYRAARTTESVTAVIEVG